MKTYLFYDLETSDRDPCFGQIYQFAAIRTDLSLNEIERHEILIRPNVDTIPSAGALLVHQIPFQRLQEGENEFDAITRIHQLINTPGTISVGYNSLSFDDEFLRFSFYRNLLPPYTHQYANRCGRMDIFPITVLYYLFRPELLSWSDANDFSLKLEAINQYNQFHTGRSHDAIVDVEITLALARTLQKDKEMWGFATGYFDKTTDNGRLLKLSDAFDFQQSTLKEALLVYPRLGKANHYQAPVLGLGRHWHYKNQTLWLRMDLPALSEVTQDTIAEKTSIIRKKPAEQELLLPTLPRFLKNIEKERLQTFADNKAFLQNHPELLAAICEHHCNARHDDLENIDADAALYQLGFPSPEETQIFQKFHQAAPHAKWQVAQALEHPTRLELARRVMGRHFAEYLPDEERHRFETYLNQVKASDHETTVNYRGEPRRTQKAFDAEVAALSTKDQSCITALME